MRFDQRKRGVLAIVHGLAGLVAALVAGCEQEPAAPAVNLPYAREYPAMQYETRIPEGRLGRFAAAVRDGDIEVGAAGPRGYLEDALAALDIDVSSQVLVFSRTSLQTRNILPSTPRAIYFNDDTYVAWIPAAPTLELSGYDPELGPVFYTLVQDPAAEPVVERRFGACLRCHDTYSLIGGGVPRFLLGSGYTGTDGELVSHEAWILTSQATPFRSRWGGWYVTGRHGDAGHLGNIVVEQAEDLQDIESLRIFNLETLDGLFETDAYLTPYSDIVALLVLEHQVEVQNLISRLQYEASLLGTDDDVAVLDADVGNLLEAMLFVDEIALPAPVEGSSGFAAHFSSLGPFAADGRSLRELDLQTRLFRFPLSYLIYSDAFAGLDQTARGLVLDRLRETLESTPDEDGFDRLSIADRAAIAAILAETLPGF